MHIKIQNHKDHNGSCPFGTEETLIENFFCKLKNWFEQISLITWLEKMLKVSKLLNSFTIEGSKSENELSPIPNATY